MVEDSFALFHTQFLEIPHENERIKIIGSRGGSDKPLEPLDRNRKSIMILNLGTRREREHITKLHNKTFYNSMEQDNSFFPRR